MKRNLVSKVFGIALVFVMIGSMLGGLVSLKAETANADPSDVSLTQIWKSEDIGYVNCMVVDDIDNDGTSEIIAGTINQFDSSTYTYHGYIYIFNALSHELDWQSNDIGWVWKIIVADLDSDGGKEIIAQTYLGRSAIIGDCYGYIYVFDGITHEERWKSDNIGLPGDLVVADLDEDGAKEIVAGAMHYYSCTRHGHVYVFDGADFSQKWKSADVNSPSKIVVADTDDDGVKEIIFGNCVTDCAYASSEGGWYYPGYVYVFDGIDFTQEWQSDDVGVPVSLAVNDVDDDGTKELIAGIHRTSEPNVERDRGYIYIFDGRTYAQEWKSSNIDTPYGLEVDNIDNDGTKEIIARTAQPHTANIGAGHIGHIYVFDGKTYGQEWKSDNLGDAYSLEVNDIDNDGVKEILTKVLHNSGWHLRILNGVTHEQEWQSIDDIGNFGATLEVTDIDNDGWKEVVVGSGEGTVRIDYHGHLYIFGWTPEDTAPPTISSVSPEDGATNVPVDAVVTATFSEAMNSSTITSESFTLNGSGVPGMVTYDPATYTATFNSITNLDYNHTYTAILSTDITDEVGNPLAEPYSWSFTTQSGAEPRTWYVDDDKQDYAAADFTEIQDAVDAATSGDTIIVYPGTYTENIDVNKDHLTIQSENGAEVTIVEAANSNDNVFDVRADYVEISGFTVQNATGELKDGVRLDNVHYCNISSNNVTGNYEGIYLYSSSSNTLTNNTALNNNLGIWLSSSSSNTLTNNTASNNNYGIYLRASSDNTLINNTPSNNTQRGICLYSSNNNTLTSNTASNNTLLGIDLELSSNNTLTSNTASNNTFSGIWLYSSSNNTLTNNTVSNNNWYGIDLELSSNNTIYLNNFIHNTDNVRSSDSANTWNSPEEITYTYDGNAYASYLGNYWDDYTGSDPDGDGIGNSPYGIDSDADNYPLVEPFENYAIGAPTNNAPIANALDISGQPDIMYPDEAYSVTARYYDPDGRDDLKYCYLQLKRPGKPLTMMWNQATREFWTYAGEEGENYLTVSGCSTPIPDTGYEVTWNFSINKNWPEAENSIDFGVFASDDGGLISGWDYDDTNASFVVDITPPIVLSVSPEDGATNVRVNSNITTTFSEPMNGSTITTASFTLEGSAVSGTVTYEPATYTAVFTPDASLDYDHTYTATLSTAITDVAGNPLAAPRSWSFKTERLSIDLPDTVNLIDLQLPQSVTQLFPAEGKILNANVEKDICNAGEEVNINVTVRNTGLRADDYFLYIYILNPDLDLVATNDILYAKYGIVYKEPNMPSLYVYKENILKDFGKQIDPGGEVLFSAQYIPHECALPGKYYIVTKLSTAYPQCSILDYRGMGELTGGIIDSFQVNNENTACEEKFNNTRDGFKKLKEEVVAFNQCKKCKEKFPVFLQVSIPEYDEKINIVLTTSLTEVTKEYKLVKIDTAFIDNTPFDAMLDWNSLSISAVTPSSISGCLATFGTRKCFDWSVNFYERAFEKLALEIGKIIFEKAVGITLPPFEVISVPVSTAICIHEGYKTEFRNPEESILVYLPVNTRIKVKARGDVDYTNAGSTVPIWGLPGVVEDYWDGIVPGDLTVKDPATISLCLETNSADLNWLQQIVLESPSELRVYDSEGRVTGLLDGEISEEIPKSIYYEEDTTIVIFCANDSYRYEVVGTDEGVYGLGVTSVEYGQASTFSATDIPTSANATHEYTVNWSALAEGEEGVTIQVDSDGDGDFENTFTAGSKLTQDEFLYETIPELLKEDAISKLGGIKPSRNAAQHLINNSIRSINKSLSDELWADGSHLNSTMMAGALVFDMEKAAVLNLKAAERIDPTIEDEVGEVIAKLTKADKILSITAIDDAKSLEVENPWAKRIVDWQIAKAEEELDKAYEYLDNDVAGEAIIHFKLAWIHAQVAIKVAQPTGAASPVWR